MNRIDLEGRRAVVTGGAQGIGRAIVERFLESGAAVAIWDKDRAEAERTAGELAGRGRVLVEAVDVTRWAEVEAATRATTAALGGIDILVCNAGIAGPTMPVVDYPIEEWQRILDIDLTGVFLCLKAIVPQMIARNFGRIVNVASIAGKEGNPNAAAYSAAKAGVIALTKSLGKELAAYDIAVNCITPAAAQEFALIPRDVTAGEFTKVTQRVPVELTIKDLDNHPEVVPGLSVVVSVRKPR